MSVYFLCFILYSFIGWVYESLFYTLQQKRFVNSGFLTGCCCPIYGIGAILDVLLLGWIESPVKLFFAGVILTCTLEYFVSWLLEEIFHERWWDYSNWPLNIKGRVCSLGAVMFGLMSVFLIKHLHPAVMGVIEIFPVNVLNTVSLLTAFMFIADVIYSVKHLNTDKLWFVKEQNNVFAGISADFFNRPKRFMSQYFYDRKSRNMSKPTISERCSEFVQRIKDSLKR